MTFRSTPCCRSAAPTRRRGRTISFFATGMSCGGTITLSRLGAGYEVRVNWVTGGIEVVPRRVL